MFTSKVAVQSFPMSCQKASRPSLARDASLAAAMVLAAALAPVASAQWTLINLHPEDVTQGESRALGVFGGQQVGVAAGFASIWNGTAASRVSLNPAVAGFSQVNGTAGDQQVGWAHIISANGIHAGLWSGTAASWVDLNPPGAFNSEAFATTGTQQVGRAFVSGHNRAVLWNGTAASWVDLHPIGSSESRALGISGDTQVGYVINGTSGGNQIAALWAGSAASYVNLNPSGSSHSVVWAVSGTQQVGFATTFDYALSACVWEGSAGSWADIGHFATGSDLSEARATNGSLQVGYARFNFTDEHACVWNFPTTNWVDLHLLLPPEFRESIATAVWSDATHDYISGYGYNTDTDRYEALLWTRAQENCTVAPSINAQPPSYRLCPAYAYLFPVYASGSAPLTYQWQWQPAGEQYFVVLVDGFNLNPFTGEPVFYAQDAGTSSVLIRPPYGDGSNGMHLRCVVTNACGDATTELSELVLCAADFNCDGDINPDDLGDFITCYFSTPPCFNADYNADGDVNPDDLGDFITTYFGPAC